VFDAELRGHFAELGLLFPDSWLPHGCNGAVALRPPRGQLDTETASDQSFREHDKSRTSIRT
jgi:hypothetical protein